MAFKPEPFLNTSNPDELRRGLKRMQDELRVELDRITRRHLSPVQTGSRYSAQYDEVVRVDPPSTGMTVLLPRPHISKSGAIITLMVVGDGGPMTIQVVDGNINGVPEVSFLAGLGSIVLQLDADRGWYMPSASTIVGGQTEIADERLLGNDSGTTGLAVATDVHQVLNWLPDVDEVIWPFDGVDDHATMGTATEMRFAVSSAFSVSVWIDGNRSSDTIFGNLNTSSGFRGWEIIISSVNTFVFLLVSQTGQISVGMTGALTGALTHCVVTYDGTSAASGVQFYRNGALQSKTVFTDNITGAMVYSQDFRMGARNNGSNPYLGTISDLSVFDTELSLAEAQEAYNSGTRFDLTTSSMASALVGFWRMDDTDSVGTDGILDRSVNSNHGTAQNGLAPSGSSGVIGVMPARSDANTWGLIAPAASGTVLTSNGIETLPTYQAVDVYTADESSLQLIGLQFSNKDDGTTNAHLSTMVANTFKANVTAGTANPTDHSFTTFLGAGLDYAAGVASVDFSSVTYTADGTTLDLVGLEFGVLTGGIDTLQLADGSVTLAKHDDVPSGSAIGTPITSVSGPPVNLSGQDQGGMLRFNKKQLVSVTPNGGNGAGGEYIASDITITSGTTHVVFQSTATGTVEFAGMDSDSIEGHRITVVTGSFGGAGAVNYVFLGNNTEEPDTTKRFSFAHSGPSAAGMILNGDPYKSFVVENSDIGNFSGNAWCVRGLSDLSFVNLTSTSDGVVVIKDAGEMVQRLLVPNDIDSSVLTVQQESDLPAAVSGVITIPAGTIIRADGSFTFTTGTSILAEANVIILGFDRNRDKWTFNTAGKAALTVTTNPGTFRLEDICVIQSSATGAILDMDDTNADRITLSRFVAVGSNGPGIAIAAADINIDALDLQGVSTGLTFTGGGTVGVVDGALISQSVGGSGNACIDLGTSANKWVFLRFASMLVITASGGVGLNGAATNGNMFDSDSTGDMDRVTFVGAGTYLSGVTVDDLQWLMANCKGIQNSEFIGGYSMTGNATATVISSSGTFVKIAGATTEGVVHRMNMSANNEMTIDRNDLATYSVRAVGSLVKGSASAVECLFQIFADTGSGFVAVSPPMSAQVTNRETNIFCEVIADLTATDSIDVRISNEDTTANITVTALNVVLDSK